LKKQKQNKIYLIFLQLSEVHLKFFFEVRFQTTKFSFLFFKTINMGRPRILRKRLLPFIPIYTKYIKHFANVEESEVSSKTNKRPKKRRKPNSYEIEITQDRWLLLPQDVWFSIFQQFEVQTLVKLQEISKGFKNLENEFQRKYKQVCIEKYKLSSSLQVIYCFQK
jgi:hypothetical protein